MVAVKLTALCRRVKCFGRSDKGATAVEFALVAPVFFLLLGVLIETSLMMFTEYAIQSGVQEAARMVRTGEMQQGSVTAANFKNKICETAGIVVDCVGKVTVLVQSDVTFAKLSGSLPAFINIGPDVSNNPYPVVYTPGGRLQPAAVVATFDWKFTMPGMNYLGNINSNAARRLVGFAIFQNEPF